MNTDVNEKLKQYQRNYYASKKYIHEILALCKIHR